ncbi:peptidylprolyl isomerase [Asticcacaulis sp. YBE204]|uniref:peptidylprolyl isomerase n=1 Tax=Asticcacaulis sp. YBE204 TaxID=1282363 RepID=UPI0004CE532C|nr:peptidylprolyl isomerase [Asticcacaulis sp. YBE204]
MTVTTSASLRRSALMLGACLCLALPVQSFAQTKPLGEGVVATVNDKLISSYDLKQRMLLLIITSGVQVTQQNYAAFQQQALRALIDENLQLLEADHFELKISDEEIDEEINSMAQQSGLTKDQLLAELKRAGVEPQTLRNQIKAEIAWGNLVNGRFRQKARVGKEQVDSYMGKLTEDSQKPQYLVAEIMIDPQVAGGQKEAEAGAQQLFDQISQGVAPFQSVARQFSNAPSAANGGDAGWLVSGTIDPKIEATLQTMESGQMTRPIVTESGVYIYYLREKTAGNSDMQVRIKQAAIPLGAGDSATRALADFRAKYPTCEALGTEKGNGPVTVTDLGITPLSDLTPEYAAALKPLKAGQTTAPMSNAQNTNVLYVCDKTLAGDNAPSRDQIENRLTQEKVSMLGRRYLRDIRAAATIETR